jgi:hypothetical protein
MNRHTSSTGLPPKHAASFLMPKRIAHHIAGPAIFFLAAILGCQSFAQTNSQQIYLQCLTNFEIYAESVWQTNSVGIPDAGYWGDGGSTGNGGIRGNSGIAVAYAVLCLALPNDPIQNSPPGFRACGRR